MSHHKFVTDSRASFELLHQAPFFAGPPASQQEIRLAEETLGWALPEALREIYACCGPVLGPTGEPLLSPLLGPGSLTEMTQFLGSDKVSGFPQSVIARSVFFGHDGCGTHFGLPLTEPGIPFRWDASWGEHVEPHPEGIVALWQQVLKASAFPTEVPTAGLPPPGTYRRQPQRGSDASGARPVHADDFAAETGLFDAAH